MPLPSQLINMRMQASFFSLAPTAGKEGWGEGVSHRFMGTRRLIRVEERPEAKMVPTTDNGQLTTDH